MANQLEDSGKPWAITFMILDDVSPLHLDFVASLLCLGGVSHKVFSIGGMQLGVVYGGVPYTDSVYGDCKVFTVTSCTTWLEPPGHHSHARALARLHLRRVVPRCLNKRGEVALNGTTAACSQIRAKR